MSVMYKDPLPSDMGIMAGWNYLDDNILTVELIPERIWKQELKSLLVSVLHPVLLHAMQSG